MDTIENISKKYEDTFETNGYIHQYFTSRTTAIDYLDKHRKYMEEGYKIGLILGHGDRAFQYFWQVLVQSMPKQEIKFLEIGVYKGQILSLIQLVANKLNKKADITGVTMLYHEEFAKYNRMPYIERIFAFNELNMDTTKVIDSSSHDVNTQQAVGADGPYDIIYIDGDHSYAGAKSDIEVYGEMTNVGGFLVVDDSSNFLKMPQGVFPGIQEVSEAVRDTIEKDSRFEFMYACGHLRLFRRNS